MQVTDPEWRPGRAGDGIVPHVLVLSTADWNAPVWTNKQHLALRLASEWPVTYYGTVGLRRPELRWRDVRRIAGRLGTSRSSSGSSRLPPGLKVIDSKLVPLHSGPALVSRVNEGLVRWSCASFVDRDGPGVLWTFSPITLGLEAHSDVVVYHCVDLLEHLPGVDGAAVRRGEAALAAAGTPAVASSVRVAEHLERRGFDTVELWENVADTALFSAAARGGRRRGDGVLFAGNLSPWKLDLAILHALVDDGLPLHLAGPVADGGGDVGDVRSLLERPGVTYHGLLAPASLAQLAGSCAVGIIPYAINQYTAGVFPMKVYEYLAAGLPVVATRLPSLATKDLPGLDLVDNEAEFTATVRRLRDDPGDRAALVELAVTHSWERRLEQARTLVLEQLGAS